MRKTYFRLMVCGVLFAFGITVFTSTKTQKPSHHDLVSTAGRNPDVSPNYRKWVLTYFNPNKDLTVNKSQVYPGKRIRYELERRGKKPKITQEFYRLVPESSPLLDKHFRSCAVVGNSGILLGSRCGPQIDSADFVFRSNLPVIEGYEKDVGTKSNFTTMNPSVLSHNYEGDLENESVLREKFVKRLRLLEDQILHIPAFVSPIGYTNVEITNRVILQYQLPVKLSYAPWNTNEKIMAMWNNSEFRVNRPSTGNVLFTVAACLCDQIHLYGFYPFLTDRDGQRIKYHYYGHMKKRYFDPTHEMTEEYRALQALHQRKALVLHTEPCYDVH
ncbi:CMP-N-acetylneuraminate-poly-alpha-2,8-sialyltransferase-like [Branchiostoma floridae x Branchiostoma japonicum]